MLRKIVRIVCPCLVVIVVTGVIAAGGDNQNDAVWRKLRRDFHQLPIDARQHTGPLFWLHGDESQQKLAEYVAKVAAGGNGCFTAESRPHNDWLGPGWFRDLRVCLDAAKTHQLKMWIFDERWWPSGEVAGRVPKQYGSKYIESRHQTVRGPRHLVDTISEPHVVAVFAAKTTGGKVIADSLVDLTRRVDHGQLEWTVPTGDWQLMVFHWRASDGRRGRLLVDGASQDAVDWYVRTVYQPHYDHFAPEFGKSIVGFFYDEPETPGDWGTEVAEQLRRQGVDWRQALVAWKYPLSDPDLQTALNYQYRYAFAEAWGRTMYGGITQWCRQHQVTSIGHWLEHNHEYLAPRMCAGDMFQVQKYSDMGAIDAVFKQFVPGQKDDNTYQTPKLGSSISHAYGKKDDLTMVEIFGARGQDLTYPEMKWWTDLMHVAGVNFHIPHSFNPRSPLDRDCPPYFNNGGYEPRWPLYRVYADYTARLSHMLHGGHHVCPVALLYLGQSHHVGKSLTPEVMTTALQDALYDCDWIPYDVFGSPDMRIDSGKLGLRDEQYRVLVVAAAEVMPYSTLAKIKDFYDRGGVVVGYGILPSRSATPGKTRADMAALRNAIWGHAPQIGTRACRRNDAGGRAYLLPTQPSAADVLAVLHQNAGVPPVLEVLAGKTDQWLHVLHRVRNGRDIMLVCNQQVDGPRKTFRLRARVTGHPERWDAMRNEISSVSHRCTDAGCEFTLRLSPLESALLVFQPEPRSNGDSGDGAAAKELAVQLRPVPFPTADLIPNAPAPAARAELHLRDCFWVWYPEQHAERAAAPGTTYFRKQVTLPATSAVATAMLVCTADNSLTAFVNGHDVGGIGDYRTMATMDIKEVLKAGANVLAIAATNGASTPNPAGLIGRYRIVLNNGAVVDGKIDTSWSARQDAVPNWNRIAATKSGWHPVNQLVPFGQGPWGHPDQGAALTRSPVVDRSWRGQCTLTADQLTQAHRAELQVDEIRGEAAAAVFVNGHRAGGFIGRPFRLNIRPWLKPGVNTVTLRPFPPKDARIILQ